jgi:hypothetical protein
VVVDYNCAMDEAESESLEFARYVLPIEKVGVFRLEALVGNRGCFGRTSSNCSNRP